MKKYIIALLSIVFFSNVISQNSDDLDINNLQPEIITLGIGTGFNSFLGDYVKADNLSPFTNIRSAYFLTLEKRFGNTFGIQLIASKSFLSDNERSVIINNNRNFESSLLQVGANFIFHFDNDFIINRKSTFAPFISAGFSYLKFDSYGDLMRGNDTTYYYWDNGQIWDVNQADTSNVGSQLIRDYTYETMLDDSIVDYNRSTFSVPITLGFKFKLSSTIEGRIFGTYNLTLSKKRKPPHLARESDTAAAFWREPSAFLRYGHGHSKIPQMPANKVDGPDLKIAGTDTDFNPQRPPDPVSVLS